MVKRIIALGDEHVRLSPEDAHRVLELERDKEGLGKEAVALGLYRKIPMGFLWVEGDAPSSCSQDSRYFGPVSVRAAKGEREKNESGKR